MREEKTVIAVAAEPDEVQERRCSESGSLPQTAEQKRDNGSE